MDLRKISTKELVNELSRRKNVRDINIHKNEYYKIQASGNDNSKLRYVNGDGPCKIIEIAGEE